MFKLNDARARPGDAIETAAQGKHPSKPVGRQAWGYLLDGCIILAMGALLFWGISTQFPNMYNDATRYQCYAISFWRGNPELKTLGLDSGPNSQCAFLAANASAALVQKMQARHFPTFLIKLVESQPTSEPLHALPPEYPLLTLIPFSLALVAPVQWYQVAFALEMIVVAGIIYFILKRYRATSAAIAFAIYLVLGSWATALGRFDLIPAGLTLAAVILAGKAHWTWAFGLLALATLFKFYPAILVLPFLIAQQKQSREKWSRWSGLGVFLGICVLVTAISLLLNVANTLEPFNYFFNRPIQVESFPATLLWFGHFFGYPAQYTFVYQSLNFLSPLSNKVSLLSTLLLVVGVLYTCWLQWRGKLDIYTASLLALLMMIIMGKVFSPQYLMWVTPLVAYVGKSNWKWLLSWGAVGVLTTLIFPFNYVDLSHITNFYPAIVVRDMLILVSVCVLLYRATRSKLLVRT